MANISQPWNDNATQSSQSQAQLDKKFNEVLDRNVRDWRSEALAQSLEVFFLQATPAQQNWFANQTKYVIDSHLETLRKNPDAAPQLYGATARLTEAFIHALRPAEFSIAIPWFLRQISARMRDVADELCRKWPEVDPLRLQFPAQLVNDAKVVSRAADSEDLKYTATQVPKPPAVA